MFHEIRLVCPLLAVVVALGCSSQPGHAGGNGGGAGTGGEAGSGGMGGEAGSGGVTTECTLSGEWDAVGMWGSETLAYGNVVIMQHPIDDSFWHTATRTHKGAEEYVDIALFRSNDEGLTWDVASVWTFPEGRRGWASDAAMAPDGGIFVVLREYTLTDGAVSDRFVKLLHYPPGGALVEAGTFKPEGTTDTRSLRIITRGSEAWFIAFDATPVPPDWHIVKYANRTLESFDVIKYGQNLFVRDLAIAPNGKIWTVGQGHVTDSEVWRATIWEEGESGFSLLSEYERTPGVEEADTMMALAFDEDGRFWTSYYTIHDDAYRWRAGNGTADAPQVTFGLNDEFALDETKASQTHRIAIHQSGEVFTGGYAVDANDWQWGVVRRGTAERFEVADQFIHEQSGDYKSNISSVFVDKDGNVWVAYQSRPATSWAEKYTTMKKMACVR